MVISSLIRKNLYYNLHCIKYDIFEKTHFFYNFNPFQSFSFKYILFIKNLKYPQYIIFIYDSQHVHSQTDSTGGFRDFLCININKYQICFENYNKYVFKGLKFPMLNMNFYP